MSENDKLRMVFAGHLMTFHSNRIDDPIDDEAVIVELTDKRFDSARDADTAASELDAALQPKEL